MVRALRRRKRVFIDENLSFEDANLNKQIEEFELLIDSTLKEKEAKGRIHYSLLEAYELWVYMEHFNLKFSKALIQLADLVFTDNKSTIAPALQSKLRKNKLLKRVSEVIQNEGDRVSSVLEFLFIKSEDQKVARTKIVNEFNNNGAKTIKNLEYYLEGLTSANEKADKLQLIKNVEKLIACLEPLQKRVVRSIGCYELFNKSYDDRIDELQNLLVMLKPLIRLWYQKSTLDTPVAEDDWKIFTAFKTEVIDKYKIAGYGKYKRCESAIKHLTSILCTTSSSRLPHTEFYLSFINSQQGKRAKGSYESLVLKYVTQLWIDNKARAFEIPLPALDIQCTSNSDVNDSIRFCEKLSIKNPSLFKFLRNDSHKNRVNSIREFFTRESFNSPLLVSLCLPLFNRMTKWDFHNNLEVLCNDFILSHDKNSSNFKFSQITEKLAYGNSSEFKSLFMYSSFLHYLVMKDKYEGLSIEELFEKAFTLELAIIYRNRFLNHELDNLSKKSAKQSITDKYKEYKNTVFRIARAWLLFLNEALLDKEKVGVNEFVKENLSKFFKSEFPTSDKKMKEIAKIIRDDGKFEDLEGEDSAAIQNLFLSFGLSFEEHFDFPFDLILVSSESNLSKFVKDRAGVKRNYNIDELSQACSFEEIDKFWKKLIGKHDEEIVFHSFIYQFLDDGKLTKNDGKSYKRDSSAKIKNLIEGSHLLSYVKAYKNKGFSNLLLDYDDSLTPDLAKKLDVAKKIVSLEDSRYRLILDDAERPVQLGHGGFGCVYKAKDLILDSVVALKLIPKWADSIVLEKKMLNEAVVMRKCRHENVVTLYDVYSFSTEFMQLSSGLDKELVNNFRKDQSINALVMEYIDDAQTLKDFVQSTIFKNYSYKEKLDLFINICKGVEQAHNQVPQVVHGDIKPENILIDKNNIPKITDFGISSVVGELPKGSSGKIFSSNNVLKKMPATVQDDIHSLGIILVYILYPSLFVILNKVINDNSYKEKILAFANIVEYELIPFTIRDKKMSVDSINVVADILPQSLSDFKEIIPEVLGYYLGKANIERMECCPIKFIGRALIEHNKTLNSVWFNDVLIGEVKQQIENQFMSEEKSMLGLDSEEAIQENIQRHIRAIFYKRESYVRLNELIFDIGTAITGEAISISKYLKIGSSLIDASKYNDIKEYKIFDFIEDDKFERYRLEIICEIESFDLNKRNYLATYSGQAIRFSLEVDELNSELVDIVTLFYESNLEILKLVDVLLFEKRFDSECFKKILAQLWSRRRFKKLSKAYFSIELATLVMPKLELGECSYCSVINTLANDLSIVFEQICMLQIVQPIIKLNSIPTNILNVLRFCCERSSEVEQAISLFKYREECMAEFIDLPPDSELEKFDCEKYIKIFFCGGTDSVTKNAITKIILMGKQLVDHELIALIFDSGLPDNYMEDILEVFEKFKSGSEIQVLKEDLRTIENDVLVCPKYDVIQNCKALNKEVVSLA